MKIKASCKRCGRDFFAEQTIAAGGTCPWDGEPFNPDYAVVLVEALRTAEEAGSVLERALEDVAALQPAFTIDPASVTDGVRASVAQLSKNLIRQG
ncbi:MAG TPA: hypothetical protein VJM84_05080 [Actinomycetota bacterium]|nr:hypothetical protein [Actinomycetota bacterium]